MTSLKDKIEARLIDLRNEKALFEYWSGHKTKIAEQHHYSICGQISCLEWILRELEIPDEIRSNYDKN